MYNLDILAFVSFRSCNKPLRNVDYLTLDVPFSRTETFNNSFFIRVCRSWNELPLNITLMSRNARNGEFAVYLGVKTYEVFLCFVTIIFLGSMLLTFLFS